MDMSRIVYETITVQSTFYIFCTIIFAMVKFFDAVFSNFWMPHLVYLIIQKPSLFLLMNKLRVSPFHQIAFKYPIENVNFDMADRVK